MRNMRDMSWQYILVGVVVVALIAGVFVYEKKSSQKKAKTAVTEPAKEVKAEPSPKAKVAKTKAPGKSDSFDSFTLNTPVAAVKTESGMIGTPGIDQGQGCTPAEYRGNAMDQVKFDQKQWARVMDLFHGIKKDYSKWLSEHAALFPLSTSEYMKTRVDELRIQRAPTPEWPDLSWRGISALGQNVKGDPILRIGGGFINLVKSSPARARFELARMVAQVWAPCELLKVNGQGAWSKLTDCLELDEPTTCMDGTYSESAWAISSSLASVIAPPPGCLLPAFKNEKAMSCIAYLRPTSSKTSSKEKSK